MRPVHPLIHDGNVRSYQPPRVGPSLNISAFHQLDRDLSIRGFAIKYVLEGTEHYTVNGDPFPVHAGQYLLANTHASAHVGIKSKRAVKGLCIDLGTRLINEVLGATMQPEEHEGEYTRSFFSGPEFLESINEARNTSLGPPLEALAHGLFNGSIGTTGLDKALFYALAERVVEDHRLILFHLRSAPGIRSGTRKDIYRRVQRAKEFIDGSFHLPLDVEDIAREAAMSEYHFFRAFRAVTGTSPHRYLMARRMEAARELLLRGRSSVLEVALLTGFADAASFTKAFRKFHGFVPSHTVRGSRRI